MVTIRDDAGVFWNLDKFYWIDLEYDEERRLDGQELHILKVVCGTTPDLLLPDAKKMVIKRTFMSIADRSNEVYEISKKLGII